MVAEQEEITTCRSLWAIRPEETANAPDSLVCLIVANIGVSPSMSGSISLNTEDDVASRPLMHSESFMGAVTVIKGLMPSGDNVEPRSNRHQRFHGIQGQLEDWRPSEWSISCQ